MANSWQIDMLEPKLSKRGRFAKVSDEVTGRVVSGTLKQVRALRIIRIIAQGKI